MSANIDREESGEGRLSWLQPARQQSQALAELRAAHAAPFNWGGQAGRRHAARPLWLTAALTAGVLGLAGVTLATLHVRRTAPPRPAPSTVEPVGVGARSVKPRPAPARRALLPTPPVDEAPAPTLSRRRPKPQAKRVQPTKPAAAAAAETSSGEVTFDGDEGGSVIIVAPPPKKRTPIFTPEEYKKQHAGHQYWHGDRL
jgi:hypothetical protein